MGDHRTLVVWQMADTIAKQTLRLTESSEIRRRFGYRDQLSRSAISVPCNIVEGYARSTPRQLKYHIDVAIGSLAETRYLLELAADLGWVPLDETRSIQQLIATLQPRLAAFARSIQDGRARHSRFPSVSVP